MSIVIVATGNPGKLKEMQAYLSNLGWELHLKPNEIEVDETGTTFLENARLKASEVARATQNWSIADDSGLAIDALHGAPGIYSARYAESDAARIQRVLSELQGKPNRNASFICAVALANPQGEIVVETEGICAGEITQVPQGSGGFGYDPIFYVKSVGKTFAEMTPEQKEACSHRGIAFSQLLPQLKTLVLS